MLTSHLDDLAPIQTRLANLLDDSHSARYGLGGMRLRPTRQQDAQYAYSQLEEIASISETHLQ